MQDTQKREIFTADNLLETMKTPEENSTYESGARKGEDQLGLQLERHFDD
jgi:hypothetical protein